MSRVFVGGFPRDLEEEELKDIFQAFGQVEAVKIVRDKRTGISRRFGFVDLDSKESADLAILKLHEGSIDEDVISVKHAVIEEPKPAKVQERPKAQKVQWGQKQQFKGKQNNYGKQNSYSKQNSYGRQGGGYNKNNYGNSYGNQGGAGGNSYGNQSSGGYGNQGSGGGYGNSYGNQGGGNYRPRPQNNEGGSGGNKPRRPRINRNG